MPALELLRRTARPGVPPRPPPTAPAAWPRQPGQAVPRLQPVRNAPDRAVGDRVSLRPQQRSPLRLAPRREAHPHPPDRRLSHDRRRTRRGRRERGAGPDTPPPEPSDTARGTTWPGSSPRSPRPGTPSARRPGAAARIAPTAGDDPGLGDRPRSCPSSGPPFGGITTPGNEAPSSSSQRLTCV